MTPVMIKSNAHGLVVRLDKQMEFEELRQAVRDKFKESADFFKKAQMAVAFEGRNLSPEEEYLLAETISEAAHLQITCIVESDPEKEREFGEKVEETLSRMNAGDGQFYKGTLRNGQVLESESSLIVLGDVNPGATVYSAGNVIVLGTLTGSVHAGVNGRENAFVVALDMRPMQIRIGDIIARGADDVKQDKKERKAKKAPATEPKIAFVEDGNIYIEKITKDVINDIPFY